MSEAIIDKIHKLLAKAESTEFPDEAEALSAKAAELMARHTIDSSLLHRDRGESFGDITGLDIDVNGAYHVGLRTFAVAIGDALGFKVLLHTDGASKRVVWYGFVEELKVAEVLLASLRLQQERFSRSHMEAWIPPNPLDDRADRFYEKRSFMIGFADGVSAKIRASKRAAEREYSEEVGVALVLADRSNEVQKWIESKFKIGAARSGRQSHHTESGLSGGRAAGARADIGQQRVAGNRGSIRR